MAKIKCGCGEIKGAMCWYEHQRGDKRRVRLAYVPQAVRDTARAAGSIRGFVRTILVTPECAQSLLEPGPWYDDEPEDPDPWIMPVRRARQLMLLADDAQLARSFAAVMAARR